MADTVTTLNPGAAGDSMDETLATQADGITAAKRPRVQVGVETDPMVPALSLISAKHPLPVETPEEIRLLRDIRDALVDLRQVFAKIYNV